MTYITDDTHRDFTDGKIYDFEGLSCLAVGGAYSIDKYYRLMRA